MAASSAPSGSAVEQAENMKTRGNQCMRVGDYSEAVTFYTKAIELHDKECKYYNNRALANMKLSRFEAAALDAERAVELQPDYAKAYSTQGAAHMSLGNLPAARTALEAGLALDGDNATMKANLARLQAAEAAGGTPAAAPAPTSLAAYCTGSRSAMLRTGKAVATATALLLVLGYFLAPGSTSSWCYYTILALVAALHVTHVLEDAGMPSFTAEYGAKAIGNDSLFLAFMCLTFSQSAPVLVALYPLLLIDLIHLGYWGHGALALTSPATAASAATALDSVLPHFTGRQDWVGLAPPARWAALSHAAMASVAQTQVMLGIFLLLSLLTPARSLIATMLHWQNLRVQAMVSQRMQHAFGALDAQILGLTHHAYCPGAVTSAYAWLRAQAAKMATPPAQGGSGGGGGLLSSCTVQ